jgi:hypothetical protein
VGRKKHLPTYHLFFQTTSAYASKVHRNGYFYSIGTKRTRYKGGVLTHWHVSYDIIIIIVRYATESEGVRRGRRLAFWRHDYRRHARKPCRRRPNDRTTAACCGTLALNNTQKHFWQRKRVNVNLTASRTKIILQSKRHRRLRTLFNCQTVSHFRVRTFNVHVDLRGIFAEQRRWYAITIIYRTI